MGHTEHMLDEHRDLIDKQDRLEKFIVSEDFDELEQEDQRLLFSQSHAMATYYEILTLRIRRA